MKSDKGNTLFDRVLGVFALIAQALIALTIIFVTLQVLLRNTTDFKLLWVEEVTSLSLVWITFLAVAWVLKKEGHIIMDLVVARLRPGAQTIMNFATSLIGLVACLIITYFSAEVTLDLVVRHVYMTPSVLEPPQYIPYLVLPVGSLLLSIQFGRRTYGFYKQWQSAGSKTL